MNDMPSGDFVFANLSIGLIAFTVHLLKTYVGIANQGLTWVRFARAWSRENPEMVSPAVGAFVGIFIWFLLIIGVNLPSDLDPSFGDWFLYGWGGVILGLSASGTMAIGRAGKKGKLSGNTLSEGTKIP